MALAGQSAMTLPPSWADRLVEAAVDAVSLTDATAAAAVEVAAVALVTTVLVTAAGARLQAGRHRVELATSGVVGDPHPDVVGPHLRGSGAVVTPGPSSAAATRTLANAVQPLPPNGQPNLHGREKGCLPLRRLPEELRCFCRRRSRSQW